MSYSIQEENLIDITTIKTVRESIRYYQLHISKKINNIKYKIYDDERLIDYGEIIKKTQKDSHKTCIIFEYDLEKNYFIKIKYTIFGNNNIFSGHKFLLSNNVETKNDENIENDIDNKKKNIKIKIKKDIKEDNKSKEEKLSDSEDDEDEDEEEEESIVSSSASTSASTSAFSSDNNEEDNNEEDNNEDNDHLVTKYFESKYKFMNNNYQIDIKEKDKYQYYSQDELNNNNDNDNIDFNNI
jgi:hypothetical protein